MRRSPSPTDAYVQAFLARCEVMRRPGQPVVDKPGVFGLLPAADHPVARLVVTDDRAYDVLAALLPIALTGMINVFAEAARCAGLVARHGSWRPETTTALIRRDLQTLPSVPLPSGLRLLPVRRSPGDPRDGVPLEDAVAAVMRANPTIDDPPEALAGYLRSWPPGTQLLAALDRDGVVRATSGCGVFGTLATVMLVNTDPDWRGRGIGQAMTAAALRAAHEHGARHACLDATDAGLTIYQRLGFEVVARTTRFFSAP